jgi:hypothetical protein
LTDLFSDIPLVANTAAMTALFMVAAVVCLDAVQQSRTAVVRLNWIMTSSQMILRELAVLFSVAILLSRGCILDMTLDEFSFLLLGCNFSSSA